MLSLGYKNTKDRYLQFFNSWYVYFEDEDSRSIFLSKKKIIQLEEILG